MWQPFRRRELFKCFVCAMRGKREGRLPTESYKYFICHVCVYVVCVCVDNIVITKRVCAVNNSIKHVSRHGLLSSAEPRRKSLRRVNLIGISYFPVAQFPVSVIRHAVSFKVSCSAISLTTPSPRVCRYPHPSTLPVVGC